MRLKAFIIFFFSLSFLSAQDTIRVMQYNLLYYGENTGFCNFTNNNPEQKEAWLRTIISYTQPDIFTVNEMTKNATYQNRVLDEVMNQVGGAVFEMAASPNLAGSNIVNQLYYNTEKLALHSQAVAQSEVRDIDVYSLYYLDDGLVIGDTIFIHCIVAHLKAGSSSSDEQQREVMTANALDYLEANGRPGNYMFMGDFNFYDDGEDAFQLMITNNDPVFRFYDPVDEIGDWHTNAAYQHVHTQSTHTNSGDCHASGGMDDRFDFILMNEVISNQGDRVHYLEDTYYALGQDGIRLDGSLLDPPNTSLPAYVLDALFNMSDHLPVIMDLFVEGTQTVDEAGVVSLLKVFYTNPVKDILGLRISSSSHGLANLRLLSASGGLVYQEQLSLHNTDSVSISMANIPAGMYFLHIIMGGASFTGRLAVIK